MDETKEEPKKVEKKEDLKMWEGLSMKAMNTITGSVEMRL